MGEKMRQITEPHSRQRMRPWLEARINSGEIPGLIWLDQVSKIFKVPWKHGGKHDWKESEAQIFKEWAVHTGKFREGVDDPDFPTWKTRFRCALNKLPDIQELKDRSKLDDPDPFRVYQFRHQGQVMSQKRCEQNGSRVCAQIPTTVEDTFDSGEKKAGSLTNDLKGIDVMDLVPYSGEGAVATHIKREETEMDTTDGNWSQSGSLEVEPLSYSTDPSTGAPLGVKVPVFPQFMLQEPKDHWMLFQIRYRTTEVVKFQSNSGSCRVYSVPDAAPAFNGDLHEPVYGSDAAEKLVLPQPHIENQKQFQLTSQLLNVMDRGVLFDNDRGNIYATRKCRCVIFVALPHEDGVVRKLVREERLLVFDYQNYFKNSLNKYLMGQGPKPVSHILMSFGQSFQHETRMPYTNLLISATVFHCKAYSDLDMINNSDPHSPSIQISKSDDYDKLMDVMKKIVE